MLYRSRMALSITVTGKDRRTPDVVSCGRGAAERGQMTATYVVEKLRAQSWGRSALHCLVVGTHGRTQR